MSILERLNTLEERIEYYEGLEPFKYSRKKTNAENKEIAELRDIIGIPRTDKNTQVRFNTS